MFMVEAAGIEPASRNTLTEASTHIVHLLSLACGTPMDRIAAGQFQRFGFASGAPERPPSASPLARREAGLPVAYRSPASKAPQADCLVRQPVHSHCWQLFWCQVFYEAT